MNLFNKMDSYICEDDCNEIDSVKSGKYKDIKLNDHKKLYLVVCNEKELNKFTIVRFITCTYSGKCYLVEDIISNKSEWLMYYDLYPLNWKSHDGKYRWYFNINYEKIIKKLIEC